MRAITYTINQETCKHIKDDAEIMVVYKGIQSTDTEVKLQFYIHTTKNKKFYSELVDRVLDDDLTNHIIDSVQRKSGYGIETIIFLELMILVNEIEDKIKIHGVAEKVHRFKLYFTDKSGKYSFKLKKKEVAEKLRIRISMKSFIVT